MQPTTPTTWTYPPAPRRLPPRKFAWPWTVAAAVLALVLGVVGTLAVQRLAGPGTFTVRGSVDVTGGLGVAPFGAACDTAAVPGAADLAPGGQVVVYDAAGRALAFGVLGEGTRDAGGGCVMPFTVPGVPDGGGPFFVEVTHRGRVGFSRGQAGAVTLAVALR
jgi:hypothetical protein